jgi:hypothetical protein
VGEIRREIRDDWVKKWFSDFHIHKSHLRSSLKYRSKDLKIFKRN